MTLQLPQSSYRKRKMTQIVRAFMREMGSSDLGWMHLVLPFLCLSRLIQMHFLSSCLGIQCPIKTKILILQIRMFQILIIKEMMIQIQMVN